MLRCAAPGGAISSRSAGRDTTSRPPSPLRFAVASAAAVQPSRPPPANGNAQVAQPPRPRAPGQGASADGADTTRTRPPCAEAAAARGSSPARQRQVRQSAGLLWCWRHRDPLEYGIARPRAYRHLTDTHERIGRGIQIPLDAAPRSHSPLRARIMTGSRSAPITMRAVRGSGSGHRRQARPGAAPCAQLRIGGRSCKRSSARASCSISANAE